jgi:ppGpp synthetase/RelA/SpoT-type nucleotidyltranferase
MSLADDYKHRFMTALSPIAEALEQQLRSYLSEESNIDRISARAKSVDRFLSKAEKKGVDGNNKYSDPLNQIQDQVGARIVTFYVSDIKVICAVVEKYYRLVETKTIVPDSEWEFGYFGNHYILLLPRDVIDPNIDENLVPEFFELQVKTLFQHAWSEANHDLGYKPGAAPLMPDEKRRLAFTAAQAWGADRVFDELYQERSKIGRTDTDECDVDGR